MHARGTPIQKRGVKKEKQGERGKGRKEKVIEKEGERDKVEARDVPTS